MNQNLTKNLNSVAHFMTFSSKTNFVSKSHFRWKTPERLHRSTLVFFVCFFSVYNNDALDNYRPIIDKELNTLMQTTSLIIVFIPSLSIYAIL